MSVIKATNKTPFEIVFGQRSRSDIEIWKSVGEPGVEHEENLPNDFLSEVNECRFHISYKVFWTSLVSSF